MLDENQLVTITWYSGNKDYYSKLGYEFTKMNDTFQVPFKLALHKTKLWVKVRCDYCGEEYTTRYSNYKLSKSRGKVACKKCKQLKIADTLQNRYGSSSLWGSQELREKAKQSMRNKYGCEYAMQSKEGQKKFKSSMLEKYGYENPSYSPDLQAKAKSSMYENGKYPTSVPERQLIKMLIQLYGEENCKPGYPVDKVNFDCLLTISGCNIDVEYDGLYWHQGMEEYDRKRNHWLISKGYKVLRVKGNKYDELPTIERLKEEVDYLLDGHSIGYIDMNN